MSPPTMHGKILFDEQLDPKENRFNNESFNRSVWFIEDLLSHNTLDFCQRYLQMPSYEEMYDLILEFFRQVQNPAGSVRYFDSITGKRFMYHLINNEQKRQLYHVVDDNTAKRNLIIIQERMPNCDSFSTE